MRLGDPACPYRFAEGREPAAFFLQAPRARESPGAQPDPFGRPARDALDRALAGASSGGDGGIEHSPFVWRLTIRRRARRGRGAGGRVSSRLLCPGPASA